VVVVRIVGAVGLAGAVVVQWAEIVVNNTIIGNNEKLEFEDLGFLFV